MRTPGLRSAAAGRRQQPGERSLGPQWPSRRPAPARAFIWCPAFKGVWVCQLLGFRNFPPEGSQSFKGTANEETGAPGGGARWWFLSSWSLGSDLPKPEWTCEPAPGGTVTKRDYTF